MERKFKVGDVVVLYDNRNLPMFKMTIDVVFPSDLETYEYQCAFFELGILHRERFNENQLLTEEEFIQKIICENRNSKIDRILK